MRRYSAGFQGICGLVWALMLVFGLCSPGRARAGGRPPAPEDVQPFSDRYLVEIPVLGSAQARLVVAQGIDVDDVRLPDGPAMPGVVKAYLNDRERDALQKIGFDAEPIVDESRRMSIQVQKEWQEREAKQGAAPNLNPMVSWPTYSELVTDLQNVANAHPDICKLVSIGNSVQGRAIWFVKISSNVNVEEAKPEFKFTSSIHGNEDTGMELCRRMVHYLTDNYAGDPRVANLVNNAELWFCPLHNPDGYVAGSRYNANGIDLNRNFPDPITDPNDSPAGRQIETQNFMNFGYAHNFILSANYHGGNLVANIPWDCQYTHTPDHDMIWDLALGYTSTNLPMWNSPDFVHGVTLGADWYVVHGGMQDWCYNWRNEVDVTIEVSTIMKPAYSTMDTYWNDNRESMLYTMERVIGRGIVQGVVTDAETGLPLSVTVNVVQIGKAILSDPDVGDYHRMLLPGTYTLTFSKTGYDTQTFSSVQVSSTGVTTVNVSMWLTTSAAKDPGGHRAGMHLSLSAPRPNPAVLSAGPVEMDMTLPAGSTTSAGVFDVNGREVRSLLNSAREMRAGRHLLRWNGCDNMGAPVAAGIYWVRVAAGREVVRKPVAIVR